jgi:hypothetical protein
VRAGSSFPRVGRPRRRAGGNSPPRPSYTIPFPRPAFRRLRAYVFDPSLSTRLDTAVINQVTLNVPWEFDRRTDQDCLEPGPVGEYLEVVDFDPASDCFYAPVDLNHPYLLAQDGLAPSEGNPQFHQQMVYAVAMTTIRNFERALGRTVFWAPRHYQRATRTDSDAWADEYVARLRIYPHALREANAYYSPTKKALLFGYFPATPADARYHLPGGIVFTCLSHDIIAHETTHALLDGMHRRLIEPSNPDTLAFHEAFADIVGLLQHFTYPEVLRHQIARTRGDLGTESLLGQLAQEFGQATGAHRALRDALGNVNATTGQWERARPDPTRLQVELEPHARGGVLVAAIFDAFLSIYRARVADLLRIATSGTGLLPAGALHPDLVNRLAEEAAKSAQHMLTMCIRALDYCPPVDLTFGEYLRALITADYDLVPDDDRGYRIAVAEAFRQHGIFPRDVRSLSVDSLRWAEPSGADFQPRAWPVLSRLRATVPVWNLTSRRTELYAALTRGRRTLHRLLADIAPREQEFLGLDLRQPDARFEVHSLRPARRVGPDGQSLTDLVIEITQWKAGYLDPDLQERVERGRGTGTDAPPADFAFRGGCTLVVDLETSTLRYCIVKRITNRERLVRQRAFVLGEADSSLRALYFGRRTRHDVAEPFALLHRLAE